MNLKNMLAAGIVAVMATAANAAPIKVELWDVLAQVPSVIGSANPSLADQDAARTGGTDEELHNRDSSYLTRVEQIIGGNGPDAVFYIDSADLAAGYAVNGMTGLGGAGDPTINDFFGGLSIAGVGNNPMLGTILRLTGTVNTTSLVGNDFAVRSDDGYRVTINGNVEAEVDMLQAPTTTNHAYGGAGLQLASFEMLWFETQRVEAALQVTGLDFVAPIPLPAAGWLLLGGIGALVAVRRRKQKQAA
jgi:hypothetical protein